MYYTYEINSGSIRGRGLQKYYGGLSFLSPHKFTPVPIFTHTKLNRSKVIVFNF